MGALAAGSGDSPAGNTRDLARLTGRVGALCLGAAAAFGIVAAFELRPLFADGFYYLLRILHFGDIMAAPARGTVELIRQWPLLAADALGMRDLDALAVIFGAAVQLAPLVLVALAWLPLPATRKWLFVFPLLHVAAGTMASSFVPITEGATAAAYFWLLLFCVIFAPLRGVAGLAVAVLAGGTILLHEAVSFLGPVLAFAALLRARDEASRGTRIALAVMAAWFAAVAALHVYFVLYPSHPANRAAFFEGLLHHYWATGFEGSENLPALLGLGGLAGAAAIAALQAFPGETLKRAAGWAIVVALASVSAWEIGKAIAGGRTIAANAQFAARNHALLLSLPLGGIAVLVARAVAPRGAAVAQALAVGVVLTAGALAWHAAALRQWSDYVGVFRRVLAAHSGYVAFADAVAPLPPAERRLMLAFSHGWLEPSISIVLSPGGDVRTIIGVRAPAQWQAFDPRKSEDLPRHRAWRFDAYLAALAKQGRRGETTP